MTPQHIEVVINEELYAKLLAELELEARPPALSLNHSGFASGTNLAKRTVEVRGVYSPATHTVYVSTGNAALQRERIIESTKHLLVTFLHEMRHAHQHVHWGSEKFGLPEDGGHSYWDSREEVDARAWSEGAAENYKGLVRISRRPVGGMSGLGRMSQRAARRMP